MRSLIQQRGSGQLLGERSELPAAEFSGVGPGISYQRRNARTSPMQRLGARVTPTAKAPSALGPPGDLVLLRGAASGRRARRRCLAASGIGVTVAVSGITA